MPEIKKNIKRDAVLFLCHVINKQVIFLYKKLLHDIGKEYDVYWAFQSDNGTSDNVLLSKGINVFRFSLKELNTLGYTYLERLYGSEHYIMEFFALTHSPYDYYWIIEYDVTFTGNWHVFFDSFKDNDADLLSSHIEKRNMGNMKWEWWDAMSFNEKCILAGNKFVKSFNPIYRISRNVVLFLDSYLKKTGNMGFYEVLISTVLHNNGFRLEDFGGTREFTKEENRNRFYVQGNGVNNGTMRWRPIFSHEEVKALGVKNKLFHPVREDVVSENKAIYKKEEIDTRIVYVLVADNPKYMYFLHLSIFSLLNFNRCKVTVLTDKDTLFDNYISSHAEIQRIEIPDIYDTRKKSRFLKTQVGTIIKGRFLFIDCDTLIISSLKEIDDFDDDIACTLEYNNPYVGDQNYIVANTEEVGYMEHVDRKTYYNSGILFSNGSKKAKDFFQKWHENWKDYCSRFNKEIDQPAMHKTNTSMDLIIRKLPDKYNWMIYMKHYVCKNVKIIHYWHHTEGNKILDEIIKMIEEDEEIKAEHIVTIIKSF